VANLNDSQYEKISAKLDRIINLLALNAVKGLESEEQVGRLSDLKFQPSEIAPIVGKSPNAVRITLYHLRKKRSTETEEPPADTTETKDQEGKP
jgi:hypothetical protein